jgi:hypothetical protein
MCPLSGLLNSLKRIKVLLLSVICLCSIIFSITLSAFTVAPTIAYAGGGTPSILGYQGRLTDGNGDLLGGSGTTYYFKFSIWDNATVANKDTRSDNWTQASHTRGEGLT